MPTRNPAQYPADWKQIAAFIKETNGYVCQECGRQCTRPGQPYTGARDVLTVAHYDHDYTGAEIFLSALCGPCHLRHDAPHSWVLRRRQDRYRQALAGQLFFNFGGAA